MDKNIKDLLAIDNNSCIYKYNSVNNKKEKIKLLDINMISGIGKYRCPDCQGTGIFWITSHDKQTCVKCKSAGWVNIVLF